MRNKRIAKIIHKKCENTATAFELMCSKYTRNMVKNFVNDLIYDSKQHKVFMARSICKRVELIKVAKTLYNYLYGDIIGMDNIHIWYSACAAFVAAYLV